MNKSLLLKLIKNKRNNQINISIPKRRLPCELKKKLWSAKEAKIFFEDFK